VFDELRQGVSALDFLADAGTGSCASVAARAAAGFISVVVDRLSRRYPRAVFNVIPADPTALMTASCANATSRPPFDSATVPA
jgi:hypothetical protein